MHLLFRLVMALLGLLLWHTLAWATATDTGPLRLQSATLVSKAGERVVALPHVLDARDFDAQGSRVRYRLTIDLPQAPEKPLGIFINKLSLAGALSVNGQLVDQCAYGEMERLRCLHRPLLFKPATHIWHAGTNTLEIEVHASHRQVNGLSEVQVGDANRLYTEAYAPRFWWIVTLNQWLAFAIIATGLLALAIGLSLREEAVYRWYGFTCLFLAASFLNLIADQLPLPMRLLNWVIVVGRLMAAHLFTLTCLCLFEKIKPWHTRWTLGYGLLFSVLFYFAQENRSVVALAYLPILVITPLQIGYSVRWSLQSGVRRHQVTCFMLSILFALGTSDWLKFGGQAGFEYVYLMPYGFSVTILFIGLLLILHLIESLQRTRELSATLESKVASRTAELESALQTIQRLEQTALQLTEAIPVGTFVIEMAPRGRSHYTFLSKRWLDMLDLDRAQVMADAAQVFQRVHPDDLDDFMSSSLKVSNHPMPFHWEGRIVVRGETRWLSVEAVPRPLLSGNWAFEGVIVDITVYKDTQEALRQAYEQLTEAAIEHSKLEEREQLLQDMHDGFGSQLASARLMAEAGRISPQELPLILQECMADLYLVADTLSHTSNTLTDSLADMKFRTGKRTEHLPVCLTWQIELDDEPALSQRTMLQILRIVQEAINNALKHARAPNIVISVRRQASPDRLCIRIADDGIGYPQQAVHGRGVRNMQQRARTMGATLQIMPGHPGTHVTLELPLP